MHLMPGRNMQCGWYDVDSVGRQNIPGTPDTLEECLTQCETSDCMFAAFSATNIKFTPFSAPNVKLPSFLQRKLNYPNLGFHHKMQ